jgi:DNA polymerase IV
MYRLTRDDWMAVVAGRPTDARSGTGARTARKLAAAGITSVGQLARADPVDLAGRFGPTMGLWCRAVALGAGSTEVSAEPYVAFSRSRETTF